jgi:hypothetical protein
MPAKGALLCLGWVGGVDKVMKQKNATIKKTYENIHPPIMSANALYTGEDIAIGLPFSFLTYVGGGLCYHIRFFYDSVILGSHFFTFHLSLFSLSHVFLFPVLISFFFFFLRIHGIGFCTGWLFGLVEKVCVFSACIMV